MDEVASQARLHGMRRLWQALWANGGIGCSEGGYLAFLAFLPISRKIRLKRSDGGRVSRFSFVQLRDDVDTWLS